MENNSGIDLRESRPLLEVEDLVTVSLKSNGEIRTVDGVSFHIDRGEIYGLVGESGSAKSTIAKSIMDIIPQEKGYPIEGRVLFNQMDLLFNTGKKGKNSKQGKKGRIHDQFMTSIRGRYISLIMQDSFKAMNPDITVGQHMTETLMAHRITSLCNSILKRSELRKDDIYDLIEESRQEEYKNEQDSLLSEISKRFGLEGFYTELSKIVSSQADYEVAVSRFMSRVKVELKEKEKDRISLLSKYYQRNEIIMEMEEEIIQGLKSSEEVDIEDERKRFKKDFSPLATELFLKKSSLWKTIQKESWERSLEILRSLGIENPETIMNYVPDKLPPGLRHMCLFAMGIVTDPELVILDETTSSMDVITRGRLLDFIEKNNQSQGTSYLLITNEITLLAGICHRIGVIYGGKLIEESTGSEIFSNSKHPFTINYLSSSIVPYENLDVNLPRDFIDGEPPDPENPPSGCMFHPRCKFAMDVCSFKIPKLINVTPSHRVACFLYSNESEVH